LDVEEAMRLILREPTEEVLTQEQLKEYLETGVPLTHYIGFEISGFVHLGTGIVTMRKVADLQRAGVRTKLFLADYHSWINKKLSGDLDTIKRVALGYFKEALLQSLRAVGGDPEAVEVILASEFFEKLGVKYFENFLKVSNRLTLSRVKRSITIIGRRQGEGVSFGQLVYVPMQVADIFSLGVNLPHGGMDQRKAHVIAIEVGPKEFGYKPVALHHHLLLGLHLDEETRKKLLEAKKKGDREAFEESLIEIKMSKSIPQSAIFVHDTPQEIKKKLRKAFCPMGEVEMNPVLDLVRYVIFPWLEDKGEKFVVVNKKTGERREFEGYSDLERAFALKEVHPLDLKMASAEYLIEMLEPVRKHFLEGPGKKYLEEMNQIRITR